MNAPDAPAPDKTSKGLRLLISIVCLLFFLGGSAAGVMAYRGIQEAQQSLQWPTVAGRMVRSGVDVSVHRDRSTDRDRRNRETRSYSAGIEYEFKVNEQTVKGSRITVISDQFGSKAWAEAVDKNAWTPALLTGKAFDEFVDRDFAGLRAIMVKSGMI